MTHTMTQRLLVLVAVALVVVACSSDDGGDDGSGATSTTVATATTQPRPAGPAAEISELPGDGEAYLGKAIDVDLDVAGYVEGEYAAAGTATSYTSATQLSGDGVWKFVPGATAPYKTRIVVRRPASDEDFSGIVVLEWLNVSGGVDADPEWVTTHEELIRNGDVWVGVSAQAIGVEGGPVIVKVEGVPGAEDAGKGLVNIDAARYGSLKHPGDGFSFDIYTQVGRAVRSGEGLSGLKPRRLIAAGQSQSAFAMVTYYNGVQPLTLAFDGFFVHSRGAAGLPLVAPGAPADIAGAIGGVPTTLRTDLDAPVMNLQTETDVTGLFGTYKVRQEDSDRFRLWEVAGTAHFDQSLLSDPATYRDCGAINNGPLHVVAKAAMHALEQWVEGGDAPVEARRLDVTPDGEIARDSDGIATGGIRTPPVDVPVATLSGAPGPSESVICSLLGTTTPFTQPRLAELYRSRDDYEQKYGVNADATIDAQFALDADRDALMGYEAPSGIPA
jgi:hypothetical protein